MTIRLPMRTHRYRLVSAAIGAACGIVLWSLMDLATVAPLTPLRLAAMLIAGGVGLVAVGLMCAGQHRWEGLHRRGIAFVARLRSIPPRDDWRTGRWLMALGLAGYVLLSGWNLSRAEQTDDDQLAFLQRATEVHAAGGPLSLLRELYAGRFEEANRHPLYIGLLSLHPTWTFGRGLSLAFGVVTLVLLTEILCRQHGPFVAGLFCLLLGTNGAFCLFSTRVVCEVPLVLWTGLVYLVAARTPLNTPRTLLLGTLLALSWLTKGTGLLLIVGFVLWYTLRVVRWLRFGLSIDASAPVSARALVLLLVTLLLIASPLLTRNLRRFGSPVYNVNSQLLFVDEYEDPVELAEQRSTSAAARAYLQTHQATDILHREASGLAWESFILLRILGPAPLDDARILFGLPLLLGAIVAVIAAPRPEHALLAAWLVVCLPLFAWYIPVAAGDRFPLPLLAPLLMLAAEGIARPLDLRRSTTPR